MERVEDSYDGAMRKLAAIGHASEPRVLRPRSLATAATLPRPVPAPGLVSRPDPAAAARMRELEELASLACDENERLQAQLLQLTEENEALRRRIGVLDDTLADPRAVLGLPSLPSVDSLGSEFAIASRPRGGAGPLWGLGVFLLVGAAAVFATLCAAAPDTNLRWAGQAFFPAQLAAGADALDQLIASAGSVHPRYGRTDVALPMPAKAQAAPVAAAPVAAPASAPPASAAPAIAHPVSAAPAPRRAAPSARKAISRPARGAPPHVEADKPNDPLAGMQL